MMFLPQDFHFLRPYWFLALVPCALLAAGLWMKKDGYQRLDEFCDPALLPYLLLEGSAGSSRWRIGVLLFSWIIAVTALAGPVWERQPQPVFRLKTGRVIVLDMSPSMSAADIKPSRLKRAVFKIKDILAHSKEGFTGLVVFGKEPFTVVPLTDDTATIEAMLPALSPDIIPAPGDEAAPALKLAASLLSDSGIKGGEIILISDGINDMASVMGLAGRLKAGGGITLSVLGVGTEKGAPVPQGKGGFEKDSQGRLYLSRVDRAGLRRIATAGGGRFAMITHDDSDIRTVLTENRSAARLGESSEKRRGEVDLWKEQGVWLVLLLLPVCLAAFRRGWLLVLLLVVFFSFPQGVQASFWKDLWQREDQQAWELFQQKKYDEAARLFKDPERRAAALYRAGRYKEAAKLLEGTEKSSDAIYNRGNSLARAGRFEDALKAYNKALELDPGNSDARYNRDLVKRLLEEQKRQKERGKSGKEEDEQDEKSGKNGDKGESRGEKKDSDSKDNGSPKNVNERNSEPDKKNSNRGNSGRESNGQESKVSKAEDKSAVKEEERDSRGDEQKDQEEKGEAPLSKEEYGEQPGEKSGKRGQDRAFAQDAEGNQTQKSEEEMAIEQWLRQIPDDPSGLLRRKFYLELKHRREGQMP